MENQRIYSPPQPTIVTKDTVIDITGVSGFLLENLGNADMFAGPVGQEIVPITSGQSRPFECPGDGGIYSGYYSIKFGSTGTKKALVLRNNPSFISDGSEDRSSQMQYKEQIV